MGKHLLLDIDNTLFDGMTPRPYLKEFLDRMSKKYELRFYTSANQQRIYDVTGFMYFNLGMDTASYLHTLRCCSFDGDRFPMKERIGESGGSSFMYKDLTYPAQCLFTKIENVFLLDDMPMQGNPHPNQRIQAPGFLAGDDDTYLRDLDI